MTTDGIRPLVAPHAEAPWSTHWITRHQRLLVALASVIPVLPLLVRRPTLWYDEGYTYFYSRIPLGSFPRALWDLDLYTAGFYVVERAGVTVFGDGQLGLRVVPALFAAASVLMFAAVLRRRGVRPTPVVVLSALFAAAPAMAAHAGNGRAYSMVTFWYLWCLYVCLADVPLTPRRTIGIAALLGGGMYVHASILIGLPLLALVVVRRYGVRAGLRPLVLGGLLTLPLGLQLATHNVNGVGAGLNLRDITPRRLGSILWHFTWHPILLLVLSVALVVLLKDVLRRRSVDWRDPDGIWIELAGLVLPGLVAVAASPIVSLWSWSDLWLAAVGVYLAGARGVDLLAGWVRAVFRWPRWVRLAVAVVVIASLIGVNVTRDFSNDDLQEAYGQLVTRAQAGDVVVAPILADALSMRFQAARHRDVPAAAMVHVLDDWREPLRGGLITEVADQEFVDITSEVAGRRVWLVHWDATLPVSARAAGGRSIALRLLPDYCFDVAWTGDKVIILEGRKQASCTTTEASGG